MDSVNGSFSRVFRKKSRETSYFNLILASFQAIIEKFWRFFSKKCRIPPFWAPLKICFLRLFASGQSPTGKIFDGYLQVATLKSSCIGLFAHTLKIHPPEFLEIPSGKFPEVGNGCLRMYSINIIRRSRFFNSGKTKKRTGSRHKKSRRSGSKGIRESFGERQGSVRRYRTVSVRRSTGSPITFVRDPSMPWMMSSPCS